MKRCISVVFPGQGSQHVGMGKTIGSRFEIARRVFEEADEALGLFVCTKLMQNGDTPELNRTENAQPAILAHGVAIARVLEHEYGFSVSNSICVLGHSLGEFTALTCAGALNLPDAVKLVRNRGKFMQISSDRIFTPESNEKPMMVALMPASFEHCVKACEEANVGLHETLYCNVANVNGPKQIVISGSETAVTRASTIAKEKFKVRRAVPLKVSAPFHSAVMQGAKQPFVDAMQECKWNDLRVPLISNVTGDAVTKSSEVRKLASDQLASSVRWDLCVQKAASLGSNTFVELGADVLGPMIKSIATEPLTISSVTESSVEDFGREWDMKQ